MTSYPISKMYHLLWNEIIQELITSVCNSNINYCVRYGGDEEVHQKIGELFEEYRRTAQENMVGHRLDRHKLASCICAAIIEAKPLTGFQGSSIVRNANEILGLYTGLNVIKYYMLFDYLSPQTISQEKKEKMMKYLKEHFEMNTPSLSENICDTKSYRENMANALYRSHHHCNLASKMCYHFDIWAYSKIFYHLELYNQPSLTELCEKYQQTT